MLGLVAGIALVIVIISTVIIILTGKSVAKPLEEIKNLADRINSGEQDIETELAKIEDGGDQVGKLVIAFKTLAAMISNRGDTVIPKKGKKIVYPPNELYMTNKIAWKGMLKDLPNYS